MKETLFDIYIEHLDCYEPFYNTPEESPQTILEKIDKKQLAAKEYAASLLPLGQQWVNAVNYDINKIKTMIPQPSSNEELKNRRIGIHCFLLDVLEALRTYGFDVTQLSAETLTALDFEYGRNDKTNKEITLGRKRGRPKAPLTIEHLICNPYQRKIDLIINGLKSVLQNKKGKQSAYVFYLCITHKILTAFPKFNQAKLLNPNIGAHAEYNKTIREELKKPDGNINMLIMDNMPSTMNTIKDEMKVFFESIV